MKNVKHTRLNTPSKIRDEYTTRDRSINVDTNKETGDVTMEVTIFSPVADRVFDRLKEEERTLWAEEFFNGTNAPIIKNYTLLRKGH